VEQGEKNSSIHPALVGQFHERNRCEVEKEAATCQPFPVGLSSLLERANHQRFGNGRTIPGRVHARKLPAHWFNTAPSLLFEFKLTIGNAAQSAV
jgi:hypothetical protein